MKYFGITDIGNIRKSNQDRYTILNSAENDLLFAAVCDGMGGANGGNIASSIAVECYNKKLSKYIIITQIIAMAVYIAFPNMQDLRPAVYPRDNFLTDIVAFIQAFDTNTNVCPSLHVGYSLGIASAWLREKSASAKTKVFVVVAVILVCLSTMFIKQHSVIDCFAAIPMCIFAELVVFRNEWKQTFKKLTKKALD